MKLFVLGAGATRGASFVKIKNNPCLPPLDNDFYTQIQRIQNAKHDKTIKSVIENSVNIFGKNFQLTLENVFSTIENILNILKMSRETSDFNVSELTKMRIVFLQALAAVFEESLTKHNNDPKKASLEMCECDYHKTIIENMLSPNDCIISFNYDCLIDYMLKKFSKNIWHPKFGYGFPLRGNGAKVIGYDNWMPNSPGNKENTINLFKLHGSLHFKFKGNTVNLKNRPYTKQTGNLIFDIIPPESNKECYKQPYAKLWKKASSAIYKAEKIIFIGYSFPPCQGK